MKIYYSEEVQDAFNDQRPILALESTIISHGMPYPQNLDFLKEAESLCRNHDVAPATIAIISGKIYIGIENKQIEDKLDKFRKEIKKNFLLMSTLDKKTVSQIKSKLINYAS